MDVKLKVRRFDPDAEARGADFSRYELEVPEFYSVLDCLIKVREEIDGTLALRCSCRSAICGSCAMRINGQAGLACNTKASEAGRDGEIVVEPAGNMPVVKDLITDFDMFWDKVRDVEPYLRPESAPPPGQEYEVPNEDMLRLAGVMACIMCGACVSDCTVLEVDSNFLGAGRAREGVPLRGRPAGRRGRGPAVEAERVRRRVGLHAVYAVRGGVPEGRGTRWAGSMLLREASMEGGRAGRLRRAARHGRSRTRCGTAAGWTNCGSR